MARGKVTGWRGQTGYLVDESDQVRVFFGDRALRGIRPNEIQNDMLLEFERVQGDKGPRAQNVRRAGTTATPLAGRTNAPDRPREPRPRVEFQSPAPTTWVLPRLTQEAIKQVRLVDRHPVIQLDRLSIPGDQKDQRVALEAASQTLGDSSLLKEVYARRSALLVELVPSDRQCSWTQTTAGPLTLHLSRSNVLENAGLALHPIYGFAYLPGSGLKGMARSAAQTLLRWPPERIIAIFGTASDERQEGKQQCGSVCFHDAWPTRWPKLFVDIVNNHHPGYYAGTDAPGDWESPNPVYFLAVAADSEFSFHLTARRRDTPAELVLDAVSCLQIALSNAGAGAKTAAGYGWFVPQASAHAESKTEASSNLAIQSGLWTLRLESPAFLAGASQQQEDCNLRSATLRGQLRAWWRTLHSGYITVEELRQLEAAVWGDTTQGSPIRLHLATNKLPTVRLHQHPQERASGLKYLAYGMDETSRGQRKQRWSAISGGEWELRSTIKDSIYHAVPRKDGETADRKNGKPVSSEILLKQLESALWLLVHFGGVGSKGRKGFGSLKLVESLAVNSLEAAKQAATELRKSVGLTKVFSHNLADSPALDHPGTIVREWSIAARDGTEAIEKIGQAYAKVASGMKHLPRKSSLGLPRKIHGPQNEPFRHQQADKHQPPVYLDTPKRTQGKLEDARYSSPVQLHVAHSTQDEWTVRLLAMPAFLPDLKASADFLREFTEKFERELTDATAAQGGRVGGHPGAIAPVQGFKRVEVEIIEDKLVGNRHQYRVKEVGKPKPGMLVDGTPPSSLPKVGEQISVFLITTSDPSSPRYRWTLPDPPRQDQRKSGGNQRRR